MSSNSNKEQARQLYRDCHSNYFPYTTISIGFITGIASVTILSKLIHRNATWQQADRKYRGLGYIVGIGVGYYFHITFNSKNIENKKKYELFLEEHPELKNIKF